ncbi:MAG: UbiD family decarboxylase [Chloroflexi bacterium]|nr:UbiD family decarboxylase [Chloroflexota bacterium]
MRDLREFISALDEQGELKRVTAEVDWNKELGCVAKLSEQKRGPALLFENVKGYNTPVLTGALTTPRRFGIAMNVPGANSLMDIISTWQERINNRIPPKVVSSGPCKENIDKGEKVSIFKFPIPHWYPMDGGRYITNGCIITKDPDSGWVNIGTYRVLCHEERTLGIYVIPSKHIALHYQRYEAMNEPMPIAIAIGVDPTTFVVSTTPTPPFENEYDYIGALNGVPTEVVKAETCELPVPAHAEMVIEGEIPPGERRMEGPFGEYTGYYGYPTPKPFINIKCITYRDNPILWGCTVGRPITDIHAIQTVNRSAAIWMELKRMQMPGVVGVYCPEAAANYFVTVVSVKQRYPGHAMQVGRAVYSTPSGNYANKIVIVVDDDIDPSDMDAVWWAVGTRYQPKRGTEILEIGTGSPLDPSVEPQRKGFTSRVIIDATRPYEWDSYEEEVKLSDEMVRVVKSNWAKYFGTGYAG